MVEAVASQPRRPLIGSNAIFATLSAGSAGLMLLLSAFISQARGEDFFGRFSWALTLAMMGEALMDLGVHQITIRSIARDASRTSRIFHNSLSLKAVSGAVMFVTMAGISFMATADHDLRLACLVMLGVAILRSYLLTIRGVLQGLERFGQDALVVVGDRLLVLAMAGLAIYNGAGLIGLAAAFVLARVVALVGALLLARRHTDGVRFSVDVGMWRDLQREALPVGMFLVVLNFYSYIDTLMLGVISTFGDTGLYNNAYRIYEGMSYVPGVLSALLTPRLSQLWSADRAQHRRVAGLSVIGAAALAVAVGIPVWYWSSPLLTLVFGLAARQAETALHVLIAGLAFVFVIWILHAVALSVFQERLLLKTTAMGAVVNATLNLVLIPRYGRNGAALATVLGELMTMTLLLWGLRRVLRPTLEPAS
jgi:O-antigen/teichoic acid export membrane protein